MAVNANTQTVSAQSEEKQNMQESQTMPPQLRAARLGKQRIVKTIILTVTLLFLFVPLVSMFLFTIRHPLSGKWSFDPWIAIFTGDGSALGADLSTLWSGLGASLALCVVTVLIMLVLLVPTMVIVHIRSKQLERAIEWVATLPLTIPAIVLVVGLGPIYRWLSASQYFMRCAVASGSKYAAAAVLGQQDGMFESSVVLFRTDAEEIACTIPIGNAMIYDLHFVSDSKLCVLAEDALSFYDLDGNLLGSFSYGESYLKDYTTDGYAKVLCDLYNEKFPVLAGDMDSFIN